MNKKITAFLLIASFCVIPSSALARPDTKEIAVAAKRECKEGFVFDATKKGCVCPSGSKNISDHCVKPFSSKSFVPQKILSEWAVTNDHKIPSWIFDKKEAVAMVFYIQKPFNEYHEQTVFWISQSMVSMETRYITDKNWDDKVDCVSYYKIDGADAKTIDGILYILPEAKTLATSNANLSLCGANELVDSATLQADQKRYNEGMDTANDLRWEIQSHLSDAKPPSGKLMKSCDGYQYFEQLEITVPHPSYADLSTTYTINALSVNLAPELEGSFETCGFSFSKKNSSNNENIAVIIMGDKWPSPWNELIYKLKK